MQDKWDADALSSLPCLWTVQCVKSFGIDKCPSFPSVAELNVWFRERHDEWNYTFIEQKADAQLDDYYENLIAKHQQVPTRSENWHDLLNALIWMQFPKSKQLISQLHAQDIEQFGLTPRTPRRDRLTHFDECGMLLLVKHSDTSHLDGFFNALCTHHWDEVFVNQSESWQQVSPCVFGHATLEMLLNPFIGLTGKWLAVVVSDDIDRMTEPDKRQHVDNQLHKTLLRFDGFASKQVLRPIPVLGIPGWYSQQNRDFYNNQSYFRPQRAGVALSEQYPVRS